MKLLFLFVLLLFHVLTLLWYFLIRKDVWSYAHTQAKILGEENARRFKSVHMHSTLLLYAATLFVLSVGFTFYFLKLTSL